MPETGPSAFGRQSYDKTVTPTRILVVEDEPHIRDLVCLHLGHEGYSCDPVSDGKEALARTEQERYDLIVLDVMIPELDGLSLCRAVRNGRVNFDVPILILTARTRGVGQSRRARGGADDYLTKPFGVRELVARARALLRRPRHGAAPTPSGHLRRPVAAGGAADAADSHPWVRDRSGPRRVRIDGRGVDLTDQEFRTAALPGHTRRHRVQPRSPPREIWRGDTYVTVRSVDTLVKRLRRRIEPDPAVPTSSHGVGRRLQVLRLLDPLARAHVD